MSATLSAVTITHPPLSREEFVLLVRRHRSDDALRLFREIERLKAIERLVREGLELPANPAKKKLLRQRLEDALAGVLSGPSAFGVAQLSDAKAVPRERLVSAVKASESMLALRSTDGIGASSTWLAPMPVAR